jgi:hypothetical protein
MPGGTEFSECEEITDDRPICQGDIFERLTGSEDPWGRFGVVVTASCDIAQEKHRGILSYVPILPITDYLRLFYLPKLLERGLRPLAEELTREIHEYQAKNLPEFPQPLSEQASLEWVQQGGANEIAADLRITGEKARAKFTELLGDYLIVRRALESQAFQQQLEALARMRARQSKLDLDRAQENVRKDMQQALETLAGDCFFIGCIGTRNRSGYVAYLRLIREIQHDQIAIKHTDLHEKAALAQRIARLQSPYIYRLTQQLVDVFASIGLPDEYEKNRRRLAESLGATDQGQPVGEAEQS